MSCVRELAQYVQRRFRLPARASLRDLLLVCRDLGVDVYRIHSLRQAGYCAHTEEDDEPFIVLGWFADPFVLAHELFHALTARRDLVAIFGFEPPWPGQQGPEAAANEFARLLCGD